MSADDVDERSSGLLAVRKERNPRQMRHITKSQRQAKGRLLRRPLIHGGA